MAGPRRRRLRYARYWFPIIIRLEWRASQAEMRLSHDELNRRRGCGAMLFSSIVARRLCRHRPLNTITNQAMHRPKPASSRLELLIRACVAQRGENDRQSGCRSYPATTTLTQHVFERVQAHKHMPGVIDVNRSVPIALRWKTSPCSGRQPRRRVGRSNPLSAVAVRRGNVVGQYRPDRVHDCEETSGGLRERRARP